MKMCGKYENRFIADDNLVGNDITLSQCLSDLGRFLLAHFFIRCYRSCQSAHNS